MRYAPLALALPLALLTAFAVLPACSSTAGPHAPKASPPPPPRAVTAFVDVNVVPMTADGLELHHQTILVEGGIIRRIGPREAVAVPGGARVVAAAGAFVMPGMADMHVHLPSDAPGMQRILDLSLAHGITVIRGMQGAPEQLGFREHLRASDALAPALFLAGPPIARSLTAEEARDTVLSQKAAGYDFIKVIGGFDAAAYQVLTSTARDAHIPVCGHVPDEIGIDLALDARQSSIEHEMGYMDAAALPDGRVLDELAARTRDSNVSSCPTLDFFAVGLEPDVAVLRARDGLRYAPREDVEAWTKAKAENPPHAAPGRWAMREHVLLSLSRAGARLLVGSDSPGTFAVPGFAYVEELRHFARAGLSPYAVLHAATRSAAEYLGEEQVFGTVAEGMRADLVFLSADPLTDVEHVARPAGVMVGGEWLSREALDARLAAQEAR
jgi:imidazolonepropionase-like amidohydrolase